MQSTSKKTNLIPAGILACLSILQIILLVQAGSTGWIFLLIPVWLAAGFLSFSFWFHFVDPAAKLASLFSTWLNSIFISLRKTSLFVIHSGILSREYFLLKNKPRVGLLYIFPDSAAVVLSKSDQLRVLMPGFHNINRAEEIILCFDLKYQNFVFGPVNDESPFEDKKSGESYTNYHARQLRTQKVKSFTKDTREIYPSFRIAYQLGRSNGKESEPVQGLILSISQYFHKLNKTGEAAPLLEELIGRCLADFWLARILELTSEQLYKDGQLSSIMKAANSFLGGNNRPASAGSRLELSGRKSRLDNPLPAWKFGFFRVHLNNIWTQSEKRHQTESVKP